MSAECIHGMEPDWCGICQGHEDQGGSGEGPYGLHGGRTKQDALDEICSVLGVPTQPIGTGSSLPSDVFREAARRTGATDSGSMPDISEEIATLAGFTWGTNCDSRGTASKGGSTVTLAGLDVLLQALRTLI